MTKFCRSARGLHYLMIFAATALASATALPAHADSLAGFLSRGRFTGTLRAYYFRRDYAAESHVNADAFALGGLFNYHTARFLDGISLDVSYFTASALGTHAAEHSRIDTTLSGVNNSINALGQAYLQYRGHGALVRLGDQLIDTPWAAASDSRVLPATYQAAYAAVTPLPGLKLQALRILRYKGRTASDYFRDNNYFPPTWRGDANYGGAGDLPADAPGTSGTLALGATYRRAGSNTSLWYYDFYDFAHLVYGQSRETFETGATITPFAGVQVAREWQRSNVFARTGTRLFGRPGTAVNNFTVGFIAGLSGYGASLSVSYDHIRSAGRGALGGGALVSPYTASYATDPLYTTSMIRGMVELGPGSAWKVTVTDKACGRRLSLAASFAEYHTEFSGNDSETYFDVIFRPATWLRGLSLRNRLEIGNGRVNPGHRYFLYNRVMVAYKF